MLLTNEESFSILWVRVWEREGREGFLSAENSKEMRNVGDYDYEEWALEVPQDAVVWCLILWLLSLPFLGIQRVVEGANYLSLTVLRSDL